MKKILMFIAVALPLAFFTSCSNEDETNLTLNQTELTINYDSQSTLKASEKNCVWTSSNTFVATVDNNGTVTGNHVGEAVISATKDGSTAYCKVTVNPTSLTFTFPVLNFGATPASVKSDVAAQQLGLSLDIDTADALGYTTKGTFPMYVYAFVNNALSASSLTISTEMDEDFDYQGFLEQYFELYGEDDVNFFYMNAGSLSDATIVAQYGYDTDLDAVTTYFTRPTKATRSGVEDAAVFANREVVKKLLNK